MAMKIRHSIAVGHALIVRYEQIRDVNVVIVWRSGDPYKYDNPLHQSLHRNKSWFDVEKQYSDFENIEGISHYSFDNRVIKENNVVIVS